MKSLKCGASVGILSAAAIMMTAGAVSAQQVPNNSSAASANQLEDVVVTAERRPERMQNVPITVTAITADTLQRTGVLTTQDLNAAVPGLNFTTLSSAAVIFLRGVGTTNPVVGNESSVPVYIDDVYQPSFKGDIFSFNNIDQVEVLKGPQGTLFGRNATGGAIQITTKQPSDIFSADLGVGYESYDTKIARGYVTGQIADNLDADFAAYFRGQSGTLGTNTGTGDRIGTDQEQSYRTKWVWTPDSRTTVTASAQYLSTQGSEGFIYQQLPGSLGIDGVTKYDGNPYDAHGTFDPTGHTRQHAEALRVEHDFDEFNLVSISGYSGTRSYYFYEPDQVPADILNAYLPSSENAFSQEIQLLSKSQSKLQWILGGYYFNDVAKFPLTLTGAGVFPVSFLHRATRGDVNSYSVYGQATYPITDDTKLTAGGRFNWDTIGYSGQAFTNFGPASPLLTDSNHHTQPTYRVSLDHNFTPDVLGYASYNRGYKSGTFNLIDVPTEPATKPETLDAYEVGLKSEFFDQRVRLNGAAFYYDYKNLQVLVNKGPIAVESNAPAATIYGLDFDGEAVIASGLTARIGLSLLHDEFSNYPNATFYAPNPLGGNVSEALGTCPVGHTASPDGNGCSAKGNNLPRVPNFTLNLGATYDVPFGDGDVAFTVNDYINGGFYWHADNYEKQGSYNLLSADIAWTLPNQAWSFRVYGRNLTDEHAYDDVQESSFGFFGNAIHPRTFGGEIDYHY
jgi:iron complex outermembrane receptor protein